MRAFLTLLIWLVAVAPAIAEPLWFVSLANIKSGHQEKYERFLNAVTPIWNRHGMSVVVRVKVIDGIGEPTFTPPEEIAVIRAENRRAFNAYINDPDYQAIKAQRTDATDFFAVLEGTSISTDNTEFLARNPMAVVVFDTQSVFSKGNLDIDIRLAGQVKGPVPSFLERVKRVRVHPLSFDNNPSRYAEDDKTALVLIGERID